MVTERGIFPGRVWVAAAEAGVIEPEGHLHAVEEAFSDIGTLFDQPSGCLFYGKADGGVVVGSTHDEVGLRDNASLVCGTSRPLTAAEKLRQPSLFTIMNTLSPERLL